MADAAQSRQELDDFVLCQHPLAFGGEVIEVGMQPSEVDVVAVDQVGFRREVLSQLLLRHSASPLGVDVFHDELPNELVIFRCYLLIQIHPLHLLLFFLPIMSHFLPHHPRPLANPTHLHPLPILPLLTLLPSGLFPPLQVLLLRIFVPVMSGALHHVPNHLLCPLFNEILLVLELVLCQLGIGLFLLLP